MLIAEDEADLAEALTVFFEKNHFSVDAVGDGFSAYEYASAGDYDGILLDVMMPKMNGVEVLKKLREEGIRTPVMMLTAKAATGDRITGFEARGHSGYAEAGADIVCAAVTSAIRLVEATVNDVLGLAASVKVREQDASISLHLPGGLSPTAESTCQSLLAGLMVYFSALHDEYPDNIEVLEDD